MGQLIAKYWEGTPEGMTRKERMPTDYEAYLPDPIAGRLLSVEPPARPVSRR